MESDKFDADYLMLFMSNSDKEILQGLIRSCILMDPKIFVPFLKNRKLITGMPNKMRFYRDYTFMIGCLSCNSSKNLHYKWGRRDWVDNKSYLTLQIYDDIHFYPRLNFIVDKIDDKLFIETLPF